MNQYIEITLLSNPDINLFSLWSKVFQQIHLGLVAMQDDQGQVPIGVGFPEYILGEKYSELGAKLRLFAQDAATLSRLEVYQYLSRLSDYVHCTSIRPVPTKITGYAIYQRYQPKTNKERLARRYAKKHAIAYNQALLRYNGMAYKSTSAPFIRMQSLSSAHTFCLWIKKSIVFDPAGATFSSYGLSAVSTVPEF